MNPTNKSNMYWDREKSLGIKTEHIPFNPPLSEKGKANDDTGALCPRCGYIVKIATTYNNTRESLYCGNCSWEVVWKLIDGGFIKQ